MKLTPTTPSPIFFPTKISPTTGIEAIIELSLVAGINVPRKLIIFPLSTYPSSKIETAGPIAKTSSIFTYYLQNLTSFQKIQNVSLLR